MYPSMGVNGMQALVNGLRAVNPGIKLAQYTLLNEMTRSATVNDDNYVLTQAVSANDWWLRDASGNFVQWTSAYNAYEVNITDWAPANSAGQRWPQWKAQYDTNIFFKPVSGLDYVYNDNVFGGSRVTADWMRIGSNQAWNDPTVATAIRKGFVNYWNALRTLNPSLKIMGNADNDLSSVEYKGQLEGAFLECQMGMTWSYETWGGWDKMMSVYRTALANTKAPKDVIFEACTDGYTPSPAFMRYGLASALMENGLFAYTVKGSKAVYWADEFGAQIGTAAEAPPIAPTSSGIWLRHYTKGLVLVNPSTTATLSIDVGDGYKRIAGTQDPSVNNGQAQRVVSLPPRSGLLMLKQ
ncbi:MAG TPA: putative glycoside hydrolase [Burkholderiaceae bacterium]|nr:putative glycoside hydrolase [Burkholderiaceae bacterium]